MNPNLFLKTTWWKILPNALETNQLYIIKVPLFKIFYLRRSRSRSIAWSFSERAFSSALMAIFASAVFFSSRKWLPKKAWLTLLNIVCYFSFQRNKVFTRTNFGSMKVFYLLNVSVVFQGLLFFVLCLLDIPPAFHIYLSSFEAERIFPQFLIRNVEAWRENNLQYFYPTLLRDHGVCHFRFVAGDNETFWPINFLEELKIKLFKKIWALIR